VKSQSFARCNDNIASAYPQNTLRKIVVFVAPPPICCRGCCTLSSSNWLIMRNACRYRRPSGVSAVKKPCCSGPCSLSSFLRFELGSWNVEAEHCDAPVRSSENTVWNHKFSTDQNTWPAIEPDTNEPATNSRNSEARTVDLEVLPAVAHSTQRPLFFRNVCIANPKAIRNT